MNLLKYDEEARDEIEWWGIGVGREIHDGSDGQIEVQYTSYFNIEFSFILRDTIVNQYVNTLSKKPEFREFIKELEDAIHAPINVKVYI